MLKKCKLNFFNVDCILVNKLTFKLNFRIGNMLLTNMKTFVVYRHV